MQLHSANDQMTARVNMAFSRPQNYDSLHRDLAESLKDSSSFVFKVRTSSAMVYMTF